MHLGAAFFRDEILPNLPDVLDFGRFSYDCVDRVRMPDHPAMRINELHPWNWKARQQAIAQAA